MGLSKHKKGIDVEWGQFGLAVVIILSTVAFFGITKSWATEVKKDSPEWICRKGNEIRYGLGSLNPLETAFGPNPCRTIQKEIPSEDYPQTTEGAKQEIRDLMMKCWWMWLEGDKEDLFGKVWKKWGKDPCFVCYAFTIKKKGDKGQSIQEFTMRDIEKSLFETHSPLKVVEGCAPLAQGGGGKCSLHRCPEEMYHGIPAKKVSSSKCKQDEVCCIAKNKKDICINKGGMCLAECGEGYTFYPDWSCSKGKCCIPKENSITYLEYFQSGNGAVIYPEDFKFIPEGEMYAVSLLSPTEKCDALCSLAAIGTLGAGGALLYAVAHIPIANIFLVGPVAKGTVAAATFVVLGTSKIDFINSILVAEWSRLEKKCATEFGEE